MRQQVVILQCFSSGSLFCDCCCESCDTLQVVYYYRISIINSAKAVYVFVLSVFVDGITQKLVDEY